ncbi:MAG TPA: oxidoreductase, partial [Paludibacteraceae bacterium]|nr:oxidoreductase [Paludibacteraceae bacterium]
KQIQPLGAVTTCGSIHSTEFYISVFPFFLRGISLKGVSAQNYPMNLREKLWKKLAADWKPEQLLNLYTEISLPQLSEAIDNMLQGKLKGRILVNLTA